MHSAWCGPAHAQQEGHFTRRGDSSKSSRTPTRGATCHRKPLVTQASHLRGGRRTPPAASLSFMNLCPVLLSHARVRTSAETIASSGHTLSQPSSSTVVASHHQRSPQALAACMHGCNDAGGECRHLGAAENLPRVLEQVLPKGACRCASRAVHVRACVFGWGRHCMRMVRDAQSRATDCLEGVRPRHSEALHLQMSRVHTVSMPTLTQRSLPHAQSSNQASDYDHAHATRYRGLVPAFHMQCDCSLQPRIPASCTQHNPSNQLEMIAHAEGCLPDFFFFDFFFIPYATTARIMRVGEQGGRCTGMP